MENFKQNRKIGVAGSFQNQIMGNNSSRPVVGQGATILLYSDRHAYQVTWVSDCGTSCKISPAKMKYVGTSYGDERYEYQGYNDNYSETLVWKANKGWCKVSNEIKYEPKFERLLDEKIGRGWFGFHAAKVAKEMGVENLFNSQTCGLNLVPGFTKTITRYHSISILFGVMDEYNDPSF